MAKLQGQKDTKNLSALSNATAGFLAAFFSTFTLCPTELIKCQLQALREVQVNPIAVLSHAKYDNIHNLLSSDR